MADKGLFSKIDEFLEPDEELGETDIPAVFAHRYFWNYVIGVLALLVVAATVPLSGIILAQLPVDLQLPLGRFTLLPLAVIPLGYIAWTDIRRRFNMFHFTDRKVVSESGILSKDFDSIRYEDIVDVSLDQSFLERIFSCGHLHLSTAGSNANEIQLYGLRNPEEYKVKVDSSREEGKTAFGTGASEDMSLEDEFRPEDEADEDDNPHDIEIEEAGDEAPSSGGLTEDELEERLVTIEQRKEQLEQQHQRGQVGEEEYRKRWFVLEGRKKEVMQHLDDGERT